MQKTTLVRSKRRALASRFSRAMPGRMLATATTKTLGHSRRALSPGRRHEAKGVPAVRLNVAGRSQGEVLQGGLRLLRLLHAAEVQRARTAHTRIPTHTTGQTEDAEKPQIVYKAGTPVEAKLTVLDWLTK